MNAVIYARYSCDNQREESIEGQLRECKEFAERKGIKLVGLFEVWKVKPPVCVHFVCVRRLFLLLRKGD